MPLADPPPFGARYCAGDVAGERGDRASACSTPFTVATWPRARRPRQISNSTGRGRSASPELGRRSPVRDFLRAVRRDLGVRSDEADELIDAGELWSIACHCSLRGRERGRGAGSLRIWSGTFRDGRSCGSASIRSRRRPSKPPGFRSRRCRRRTSRFVPRRDEILGMLAVELAQATMVGCGPSCSTGFGPETSHIRSPRAGLRAARPTVVSAPRGSASTELARISRPRLAPWLRSLGPGSIGTAGTFGSETAARRGAGTQDQTPPDRRLSIAKEAGVKIRRSTALALGVAALAVPAAAVARPGHGHANGHGKHHLRGLHMQGNIRG